MGLFDQALGEVTTDDGKRHILRRNPVRALALCFGVTLLLTRAAIAAAPRVPPPMEPHRQNQPATSSRRSHATTPRT
jgi:hypothetical protein